MEHTLLECPSIDDPSIQQPSIDAIDQKVELSVQGSALANT